MSFELHKTAFVGNLGGDAEVRKTPNDTSVTSFNVAVNTTEKGEKKTTWYRVSWFGNAGEKLAQYLTKGRQVYVEGKPSLDEYTAKDGSQRQSLSLTAQNVQLLASGEPRTGNGGTGAADDDDLGDVPF